MRYFYPLLSIGLFFVFISCSSPFEIDSDTESTNNKRLDNLVLDWGEGKSSILAKMRAYELEAEEDHLLQFVSGSETYSYSFDDDEMLDGALFMSTATLETIIPERFTRIGERSSAVISVSEKKNAVCSSFLVEANDVIYSVCGFTPLASPDYKEYLPISLKIIDDASSIDANSAMLHFAVTNYEQAVNCTVVYSTDSEFKSVKTASQKSSGEFSITLTGLTHSTKYYYYAEATIDGVLYESGIGSFTTEWQKTYSVGDWYPDDITREGVVFQVDSQGTSGRVVSSQKANLQWDYSGIFCTDYGYNATDGSANRGPTSIQYAYGWCKAYGDGSWYLPAQYELVALSSNWLKGADIGAKTGLAGTAEHTYANYPGNMFWSSTQYNSNMAYFVDLSDGHYSYNSKDVTRYVVAVKKFSVQ